MLKQAELLFAKIKEAGGYDLDKIYKAYEYADKLHEVVAFLLENESMTGQQFADCMEGKEIRTDADVTLFDTFAEE